MFWFPAVGVMNRFLSKSYRFQFPMLHKLKKKKIIFLLPLSEFSMEKKGSAHPLFYSWRLKTE
jgi:hypothetical protein